MTECQRCKKQPAKKGFLYCPDCIKELKQEMFDKGYLQRVPQQRLKGAPGSSAGVRDDWSGSDDNVHRQFEEAPGEIENA